MRMLVFFDLPTLTLEEQRQYRHFRKDLISNGFIMLQESVYCRMVQNASVQKSVANTLHKRKPKSGFVLLLTVTERQFAQMEYITGDWGHDVLDSDSPLVIL